MEEQESPDFPTLIEILALQMGIHDKLFIILLDRSLRSFFLFDKDKFLCLTESPSVPSYDYYYQSLFKVISAPPPGVAVSILLLGPMSHHAPEP